MEKWTVKATDPNASTLAAPFRCEVEADPRFIAESLSKANPTFKVVVMMYSCVRLKYEGGVLIEDNKDLTKFYAEVTNREVWDWSFYGKDPAEVVNKGYDFSSMGDMIGLNNKLVKWCDKGNSRKVRDYLCAAYDTFNPENLRSHPCWERIEEAIEFIKVEGWKVGTVTWKDQGKQLVVISPKGEYYRSRYKHSSERV